MKCQNLLSRKNHFLWPANKIPVYRVALQPPKSHVSAVVLYGQPPKTYDPAVVLYGQALKTHVPTVVLCDQPPKTHAVVLCGQSPKTSLFYSSAVWPAT